jgi:hypothetical protein
MSGKLKITGLSQTPNDPIHVKAYCEGRQYAKDGGALIYASGITGLVGSNNSIVWTARRLGNGLQIVLANAGPNQVLSVSPDIGRINVTLATNSASVVSSTAANIMTAIAANATANSMVACANNGASTGNGTATVESISLTGSNFPEVTGNSGLAFVAGVNSWTADPTGVDRDCCALPYGGGHV